MIIHIKTHLLYQGYYLISGDALEPSVNLTSTLFKHEITDMSDLSKHLVELQQKKENLQKCQAMLTSQTDPFHINESPNEKEKLQNDLAAVRQEIRLCNGISKRAYELNQDLSVPEQNDPKQKDLWL